MSFCFLKCICKELTLTEVNTLRTSSEFMILRGQSDSARLVLEEIVKSKKYSNGLDYVTISRCYLISKDATKFKSFLNQGILNGTDSSLIVRYFCYFYKGLPTKDSIYLIDYLKTEFKNQFTIYQNKIDTVTINYVNQILDLDQYIRMKLFKRDSNSTFLYFLGRQIDSFNFIRVRELIENDKFPNFKNYGIKSSDYDVILMHISDYNEDQWQFIFKYLKKSLNEGGILPRTVRAIVKRHDRDRKLSCSYYGDSKSPDLQLCDCEKVDEYRNEVGLDSLANEFKNTNTALPECYLKGTKK